ncbi:MAG: cysteine-rich small domain-containing protein [Eubacterium aggregans]
MAKTEHFKFFQHRECEYFPCHRGVPEEAFNCLFCYCPLYALGDQCGGHFTYTKSGIKNCTDCTVPHQAKNYDYMVEKVRILIEHVKESKEPGGNVL